MKHYMKRIMEEREGKPAGSGILFDSLPDEVKEVIFGPNSFLEQKIKEAKEGKCTVAWERMKWDHPFQAIVNQIIIARAMEQLPAPK